MAPLFIPLFFSLTLLFPINESLLAMNSAIKKLAELDKELGDRAEEISSLLNKALSLNIALRGFHASCAAATASGNLPAIQALAETTRLEQDLILHQAQLLIQLTPPSKYQRTLNNPLRKMGRICNMPDVLECRERTTFQIRNYDGSKPAGVKAEYHNCSSVHWHYSDSRVQTLN